MPTPRIRRIDRAHLPCDTVALARYLLGKVLVSRVRGGLRAGRIVETEAYLGDDPACHAFNGPTPRNRSMFLEAGHAYVYLCYGVHHLLNVSGERAGVGAAVLLRALEPIAGIDDMRRARATARTEDLARGPGRLTAALGVDLRHDGLDLLTHPALWIGDDGARTGRIGRSTRIGLTRGAEAPLRFFVAASAALSGPRWLNA